MGAYEMADEETTRFWWNCSLGCGTGGSESTASARDDSKATHEMVCTKNPQPPPGGRKR